MADVAELVVDSRDEAAAQTLHDELEPQARREYLQYMLNRTPVYLQDYMRAIIEADFTPVPPPDDEAMVTDGDKVPVISAGSVGIGQATIAVSSNTLTSVKLDLASIAGVAQGQTVPVTQQNGDPYPGADGVAQVAGGVLQSVQKTMSASNAIVTNGDQVGVTNNDDSATDGSPATAVVTSGTLFGVKLGPVA